MFLFRQKSSLSYHLKKNPSHNKFKPKRKQGKKKTSAAKHLENGKILKETDGDIKENTSHATGQNEVQRSGNIDDYKCTVCSKVLSSSRSLSVRFHIISFFNILILKCFKLENKVN